MKRLTRWMLRLAETLFLRAHGWEKVGPDTWTPPLTYNPEKVGKDYRGGHAVNSQKYTNSFNRRFKRDEFEEHA